MLTFFISPPVYVLKGFIYFFLFNFVLAKQSLLLEFEFESIMFFFSFGLMLLKGS
jgi:hypothetical protein